MIDLQKNWNRYNDRTSRVYYDKMTSVSIVLARHLQWWPNIGSVNIGSVKEDLYPIVTIHRLLQRDACTQKQIGS